MVNFNNETTVTRPRQDVVNFIILQRRQETLDKLKEYTQVLLQTENESPSIEAEFRAIAYTLGEEIRDMLEKESPNAKRLIDGKKEVIYNNANEVLDHILYGNQKELMQAFRFINSLLYAKGLTKSDIKDVTSPEDELFSEYDGD